MGAVVLSDARLGLFLAIHILVSVIHFQIACISAPGDPLIKIKITIRLGGDRMS